jgi:RNA polymerase sigma-70 factor, ECF subfamily
MDEQSQQTDATQEPEAYVEKISGVAFTELWRRAEGERVGIEKTELARILLAIGAKCNYGLGPGISPTPKQIAAFLRALQLRDLALAQACALGREAAWQLFVAEYRESLAQMANAVARSTTLGTDLADSLNGDLFGMTGKDGGRWSPLASYSGRGTLMGFLRAMLVQRHVDHHRRTHRETPLESEDFASPYVEAAPSSDVLIRLGRSVTATVDALAPEERFLLSAWFLDQHTLLEIAQVLGVHEATVSRRIKRLTAWLRKRLLRHLELSGMSKAAAEEALSTDPRDLAINFRTLLQTSRPSAFLKQENRPAQEQA